MLIETRTKPDVTILNVAGDLSAPLAQELLQAVRDQFAKDRRDFLVNLQEATGIDSEGLEFLTWLRRECDERLGMVKISGADQVCRKVLEITRLDRLFDFAPTIDAALEGFE